MNMLFNSDTRTRHLTDVSRVGHGHAKIRVRHAKWSVQYFNIFSDTWTRQGHATDTARTRVLFKKKNKIENWVVTTAAGRSKLLEFHFPLNCNSLSCSQPLTPLTLKTLHLFLHLHHATATDGCSSISDKHSNSVLQLLLTNFTVGCGLFESNQRIPKNRNFWFCLRYFHSLS